MTRLRWLLLSGLAFLSLILAFLLQDAVYKLLIVPLAYAWWIVKFYYSLIPQLVLWVILLFLLFMTIITTFVLEVPSSRHGAQKHKSKQGRVETLAVWMSKAQRGNYYKWQVANCLGRIARGLSEMIGQHGRLASGSDAIEKYLDIGLYGSFVDFPRPKYWFQRPAPTPLDLDPKEAVDYLESRMVGREPTTLVRQEPIALEKNRGRYP